MSITEQITDWTITIYAETKAKTALVNFTDTYNIIMKAHHDGQQNILTDET